MKPMKKRIILLGLLFIFKSLPAKAICPVCTVAVGAGIGFSRWLGIDDTITGIWVGAILVSVSLWTVGWIGQKPWKFRGYKIATFIFYILLIIVPLFWMDIFFHPFNKFWGVDKLILGMIVGILFFSFGVWIHFYLKRKNGEKVYLPFQKVIITVGSLLIASGIFYWLTTPR